MNRLCYVYALLDPGASDVCVDSIRYIGKSVNPRRRLRSHLRGAMVERRTRLSCWLYSIHPLQPTLVILSVHDDDSSAYQAEVEWIAKTRALGASLHNHTDGGEGASGLQFSEESLRAITNAAIRLSTDPEWRERVSRGTKAGRAAMSSGARATWLANLKASNDDPDVRYRKGSGNRGKKRDPDSVAKTAAAHLGMTRSTETREKISQSKTGKPWSHAQRTAMTEGERYCDICGSGPFRGGRGVGNHKRTHNGQACPVRRPGVDDRPGDLTSGRR